MKLRTKVVGVFSNEKIVANLATVLMLRTSEDWVFRRYMDMGPTPGRGRKTLENHNLTGAKLRNYKFFQS